MSLQALSLGGLLLPASGDSLPLSVELNGALTVEVGGTPHAGLASSEGEHRERDGDGKVDANLSSLDLVLELAGTVSVLGEDGCSVTPSVVVHEFDSFVHGLSADNKHDRSEDLFLVAVNSSADVVDNGGANEVTLGVAFDLDTSSIEKKVTVLSSVCDETLDLGQVLGVVERSDIGVVDTSANSESLSLLNDFRNPLGGITNHNNS